MRRLSIDWFVPLSVGFAAAFFGIYVAGIGAARAEHCDELKATVAAKLEEFLEKKLALELTNKSIELIGDWRTRYKSAALLDAKLTSANDVLEEQRQADGLAEIEYLQLSTELESHCPNGD